MEKEGNSLKQLINDPSFVEWATGESDETTNRKWNNWVKKGEGNRRIALRAQKKITGIRFTSPQLPDLDDEWEKVTRDISKRDYSKPDSGKASLRKQSNRFLNLFLKTAAILLLGTFVGFSVYIYEEPVSDNVLVTLETISTDYGEKKTINLSEGSKIILGAGSELSYRSNWLEQDIKQVSLDGEAYFAITPRVTKDRPKFIVTTEDGSASVWGTRFTVNTSGEGTKVVLEEGEVRLIVAQTEEADGPEVIMKPGEKASFKKAKPQIVVDEVNTEVYTSWTTKELYFDNTPFSVLVNRIERTYGLKVVTRDSNLMDLRLTGSVDFRSLEGLLKATAEVMEVEFQKNETTIVVQQNK
ncbi:MAG: FecR domain-containing protein [Balneolaceae bacterium]|nr:FecR domain-containing protein [Balneolaceae bacterium]